MDDAPHLGDTITAWSDKDFRCNPTRSEEVGDVSGSEGLLGDGIAERSHFGDRRGVLRGIGIDEGGIVAVEAGVVIAFFRGEVYEAAAV